MRSKVFLTMVALSTALTLPGVANAQDGPISCATPGVSDGADCSPAPSGDCAHATDIPTPGTLNDARDATLCLLNKERTRRGLKKLDASPVLQTPATDFSRSMVANDFFDHVSPGGSTLVDRVKRTSYLNSAPSWALGENIAWGSGSLSTPAKTVDAWMRSAGHKRNVLTARFEHIGIGIALGAPVRLPAGQPAATYTTDFGAR